MALNCIPSNGLCTLAVQWCGIQSKGISGMSMFLSLQNQQCLWALDYFAKLMAINFNCGCCFDDISMLKSLWDSKRFSFYLFLFYRVSKVDFGRFWNAMISTKLKLLPRPVLFFNKNICLQEKRLDKFIEKYLFQKL